METHLCLHHKQTPVFVYHDLRPFQHLRGNCLELLVDCTVTNTSIVNLSVLTEQ